MDWRLKWKNMKNTYSKSASVSIITVIYVFAAVVGILLYGWLEGVMAEVWALLAADVVATVIVWVGGLVFRNVSVYDPYWSVAPPVMFTAWAVYKSCFTVPVILLLVAVWYWGVRLTGNWYFTFKGLAHEDWRYTKYRESQSPVLFHLTNFFGLNMMPTLVVFACMLPGFGLFEPSGWLAIPHCDLFWEGGTSPWLAVPGFIVCISSATIQLVADTQKHRFRAAHPGEICTAGLWKHGRHPNYFGEIQFWWGVWLMYTPFHGMDWLILAPIAMTCLFLFISIPLMERRQLSNKPSYAPYRTSTRILI